MEESQGIGYLEDGTMVVVEEAKDAIGDRLSVVITGSLQTPTGRMIFGKIEKDQATDTSQQTNPQPPASTG